jgi:hypothetical protein
MAGARCARIAQLSVLNKLPQELEHVFEFGFVLGIGLNDCLVRFEHRHSLGLLVLWSA